MYLASKTGRPSLPITGFPSLSSMGLVKPARIIAGFKPNSTTLTRLRTFPVALGNTSPAFVGEANLCSLSMFTTDGVSGTVRSPASDFGLPIWL